MVRNPGYQRSEGNRQATESCYRQESTGEASQDTSRRSARELLIASKEFASENRWRSWWCLGSTLLVLMTFFAISVSDLSYVVRIPSSLAMGFVFVRMFVIYHDFQHGAVLQDSILARCLMGFYGLLSLNPPSVWNRSHDHHHTHNSKVFGLNIGSYPIITTHSYRNLSGSEKFWYGASRHPLTMLLGYATVFFWGMSVRPFLQNPLRHFDALFSIIVHASILIVLGSYGLDVMLLGLGIPSLVASCVGAYLFFAQHNFPSARLRRDKKWSHVDAALNSSSYIPMNWLMRWLTGNIGYHHVHHLNARIPFYRLPEAMDALVELQSPRTTTLSGRDIWQCLRLKLWDDELDRLVGFSEV